MSDAPGRDRPAAIQELLDANRAWAAGVTADDPAFFRRLSTQQAPRFLWIGCSDSRVPSNQIVGLMPGEVFVHRNVANQVIHSDLNCLSTIQFGVDVLAVRHIIVCGHYGCGGVAAALRGERHGLVDNWLRHLEDLAHSHRESLDSLGGEAARLRLLATLNVVQQVVNVAQTTVIQDAWERGQPLTIHGWIYGLEDGLLRDLGVSMSRDTAVRDTAQAAFGRLAAEEGRVVTA